MSSPGNYRPDVSDVTLIFTDGEPWRRGGEYIFGDKYKSSRYGEGLLAKDRAQSLREKDVTVVGLAVGTEATLSRFRDDIREWTTEGKYFETNKDSLQSIIDQLINASCIDPGKKAGHRRPGNGYLVQLFIVHEKIRVTGKKNYFSYPTYSRHSGVVTIDIVVTHEIYNMSRGDVIKKFNKRTVEIFISKSLWWFVSK